AFRARQLARAVSAAKYRPAALEEGLAGLRQLIADEHEVRRIPRLLADIGIRLVFVEHLPWTRIDGAAFWIYDQPAVALSLRYDRIDSFWYTLLHELMHIKHKHNWSLDNDLVGKERQPTEEKPQDEQVADQDAENFLIPHQEMDRFMLRHGT